MNSATLPMLLELRTLVGYLGEQAQFAWWPTKFYEQSSRLFLDHPFPKTVRLARYQGVLEAARRLHDEHLNVGNYHLFRLPEEIEQDLHVALQGDAPVPDTTTKSAALDALKRLAADSPLAANAGPMAVGGIQNIRNQSVLTAVAGAYFSAFTNDVKSFPYLVG